MMLLLGKKLDPQPVSDVAVAPGVEHVTTSTITDTRTTMDTRMGTITAMTRPRTITGTTTVMVTIIITGRP
jgi:hypothetical protein